MLGIIQKIILPPRLLNTNKFNGNYSYFFLLETRRHGIVKAPKMTLRSNEPVAISLANKFHKIKNTAGRTIRCVELLKLFDLHHRLTLLSGIPLFEGYR